MHLTDRHLTQAIPAHLTNRHPAQIIPMPPPDRHPARTVPTSPPDRHLTLAIPIHLTNRIPICPFRKYLHPSQPMQRYLNLRLLRKKKAQTAAPIFPGMPNKAGSLYRAAKTAGEENLPLRSVNTKSSNKKLPHHGNQNHGVAVFHFPLYILPTRYPCLPSRRKTGSVSMAASTSYHFPPS